MSTNSNSSYSVGFPGLLTIVFIVLKLTHYIDWSWWWITLPLWGIFGIAAVVFAIIGIAFILSKAIK